MAGSGINEMINAADFSATCCVSEEIGEGLRIAEVDLGELGPSEVLMAITHCGLCASDLALIDNVYGAGGYPMTLGHEVAGTIEAIGHHVAGFAIGERVGVGPLKYSCGLCNQCLNGREVHCADVALVAAPHGQGGFATRIKIDARFAFKIPDAISSQDAAALMCAGLTTFAPLKRLAKPGDHVGVLGIGGLGHLAVKFAKAMGCKVTTFAAVLDEKEIERHLELGAIDAVDISNLSSLRRITGTVDLLLSTASGTVPWRRLMHALSPEGTICMLGGSAEQIGIVPLNLIHHQRTITGSAAGSRRDMREMLDFVAKNGIRPTVELRKMSEINAAIGRQRSGETRYRIVMENDLETSMAIARLR